MSKSKTKAEFVRELGIDASKVKLIGNNTCQYETDDEIIVRHFDTDVLKFKAEGPYEIEFNTGGHRTVTTKRRLNGCQTYVRIDSKNRVWYATDRRTNETVVFADGMRWHPVDGFKGAGKVPDKKLVKRIKEFANGFAAALPVEQPDGGDCWLCMVDGEVGNEHLLSHVNEKYYVPTLLVKSMKEAGRTNHVMRCAFKGEHFGSYESQLLTSYRKWFAKDVYQYMYRRLVDGMKSPRYTTTGFSV
jgi:hypothetical protein